MSGNKIAYAKYSRSEDRFSMKLCKVIPENKTGTPGRKDHTNLMIIVAITLVELCNNLINKRSHVK
jgi:hypothetical protein